MTYTIHITSTSCEPQEALSHLVFNENTYGYTDQTDEPIHYIENLIAATTHVIIKYISADRTEIHLEIYDDYRE